MTMTDVNANPLSPREARVLGVLIEKHLSTPDHYPLSLNATKNACNQKSNRDPVVSYSEPQVQEVVDALHRRQLVGRSMSTGSRTTKYRHALGEVWRMQRPELAVLSVLLLRGPQTVGEIKSRTHRLNEFESLDQAGVAIQNLITREQPLVARLERAPGQKEVRYAHLLCGEVHSGSDGNTIGDNDSSEPSSGPGGDRNAGGSATAGRPGRADEIAELRSRIAALETAFADFRKQFE